MSIRHAPTGDFETDLTQLLPRLRIYALSLTRDSVRADDLVQQTVVRSLAGRASFRPGTNFPGWLFRIQRNEFISGLRRERPTVELNDAISSTLLHAQRQESGIVMREFKKALRTLAGGQRRALLMTALEGQSHETIAGTSGVSIGTLKSRVSRARARLRQMLDVEVGTAQPAKLDQPGLLVGVDAFRHGRADIGVVDGLHAVDHLVGVLDRLAGIAAHADMLGPLEGEAAALDLEPPGIAGLAHERDGAARLSRADVLGIGG